MNKYLITGLIVLVVIIELGLQCVKENAQIMDTRHQYETLQICDSERESGSPLTTCYMLENKYNVEYVCSVLPTAIQCAVEVK